MTQKIVFFDIDGTLVDTKFKIPDSTIKAINQLKQNGHLAFISTGRPKSIISKDILKIGFHGIVGSCGCYLEYMGNEIYNIELSQELTKKALNILYKYNVKSILEGKDYIYMETEEYPKEEQHMIKIFREYKDIIKPLDSKEYHSNKITCRLSPDSEFENAREELEEHFNFVEHDKLIELIPKNFSKAKGIEAIIKYLNIDINDTYAFGDSLNDLEMLKYVKYGIAMGNSSKEILESTNYHTDTIDNDGIYKGLKQFDLI